jgi:hypothetical protein
MRVPTRSPWSRHSLTTLALSCGPSFQHLSVGDRVRLAPDPYSGLPDRFMTVVELRRPHALVFRKTLPYGGTGNWTFERRRQGMKATRVLERRRGARPLPRIITPQRTSPLRGS